MNQSEAFLHFVWEHRLYDALLPVEASGVSTVEVIDPGLRNEDAGADFSAAKIKIDGILWAGNVEIHRHSRQWLEHRHHLDPTYRNVILHVVETGDDLCHTSDGRLLPCVRMLVSEDLWERAASLLERANHLPCAPLNCGRIAEGLIASELERLAEDRLLSKADVLLNLYRETHDWYETLYIALMRSFGFGLNSDPMERLARSLPLSYLRRQRDHSEQVEALLLGQAGLIAALPEGDYRTCLEHEYRFLSHKYELRPLAPGQWRWARIRPANFPTRRLVQVGSIISHDDFDLDCWLRAWPPEQYAALIDQRQMSSVWYTGLGNGLALSLASRFVLVTNIALPLRLAWGRAQGQDMSALLVEVMHRADQLPPECNRITRLFAGAGIASDNAAQSQAVIHRYKTYCTQRKCLFCAWGRELLKVAPR